MLDFSRQGVLAIGNEVGRARDPDLKFEGKEIQSDQSCAVQVLLYGLKHYSKSN